MRWNVNCRWYLFHRQSGSGFLKTWESWGKLEALALIYWSGKQIHHDISPPKSNNQEERKKSGKGKRKRNWILSSQKEKISDLWFPPPPPDHLHQSQNLNLDTMQPTKSTNPNKKIKSRIVTQHLVRTWEQLNAAFGKRKRNNNQPITLETEFFYCLLFVRIYCRFVFSPKPFCFWVMGSLHVRVNSCWSHVNGQGIYGEVGP